MKRASKQTINFNPDSFLGFQPCTSFTRKKGNIIHLRLFWYSVYKLCEYSKYIILRGHYFHVAYRSKNKAEKDHNLSSLKITIIN